MPRRKKTDPPALSNFNLFLTPHERRAQAAAQLIAMGLGLAEALPKATQELVVDQLRQELWENPARAPLLAALSRWMED